jgi:hypothetical protein
MLGLLDRFRKKKKKEEEPNARAITELEQLCGDDKETYEALLDTIFLDPRKIEVSMGDAAKKAKEFEKAKDFLRAKLWYKIAGGLAVYEGDVKKVTKYFGECEKLAPETEYPILKNPEKAVTKAQEYYRKYLKA